MEHAEQPGHQLKGKRMTVVYVVGLGYGGADIHKIGVTNNLARRLWSLQGGNPYSLYVACQWEFADRKDALLLETHLLGSFLRLRGEWVRARPREIRETGDAFLSGLREQAA